MNYILLMNAFNAQKKDKDLSPCAVALYVELFDYCNGLEWPDTFNAQNVLLAAGAGLTKKQFDRARDELIAAEFISYTFKKCKNDNEGGVYVLTKLYKEYEQPAAPPECPANSQNEGQTKPLFVPQIENETAAYKNNNTSCKKRERLPQAASILTLSKSKFKAAFPSKAVDSVFWIQSDFDVDKLIECVKQSPGWLLANDALCDFKFCVRHYSEITAGRYKDKSLFTQARAVPYQDKQYTAEETKTLFANLDEEIK